MINLSDSLRFTQVISKKYRFHYRDMDEVTKDFLQRKFERHTEVAYRMLLDYIELNQLHQVTPIFHVISGDRSLQYVFIKIGVAG